MPRHLPCWETQEMRSVHQDDAEPRPVEVGRNLNPALKVEIPPLSRITSPGLGLFTKKRGTLISNGYIDFCIGICKSMNQYYIKKTLAIKSVYFS